MKATIDVLRSATIALFLGAMSFGIAGCEKQGPLEEAAEAIEEGVEDVGDEVEDAAEEVEEAAEDVRDAVEDRQ